MKTNKMLRLASILMVAAMISTCAISGTFAKYVTSDDVADKATVAKFGVVVTATGSLFDTKYTADDTHFGYSGLAVENTTTTDNLVAPGTKNTDPMTFSITGTPEVAVRVDIKVNVNEDIFLAEKNGLPDMTTGNPDDTFNNTEAGGYYPVVFTLKQGSTVIAEGNLAKIKEVFEGSKNHAPNTDLAAIYGEYTLTWAWDYGDEVIDAGFDKHDTLLGDLKAGTALNPAISLTEGPDADYNLDIDFNIVITVTQID
ncbi:MAG: hypothetical protein E7675_06025 [Ruminococcaceae bacterium]|nr:hypothetical protein [Oscillospiraceae bacterium]